MSVLPLRSFRRYALRTPAKLHGEGSASVSCLLIELSQDGARISNIAEPVFASGDAVTLRTACGKSFEAKVRWAHDDLAGLRLLHSLHKPELTELVDATRSSSAAA